MIARIFGFVFTITHAQAQSCTDNIDKVKSNITSR